MKSCLISKPYLPCDSLSDDKDNERILIILAVQLAGFFCYPVFFVIFFKRLSGTVFSAKDVKMNTQLLSVYLRSRRELLFLDI